ncbi:MAG: glucose-6-phosphate dehydrogenase [Ignavibacteria bacterium]|nr:glucose-6-phosphate dehydrogenase [Ignavibacteria bacterium]
MKKPDNCVIIIFGASGDLTKRKLMPAIFELYKQNNLPEKFAVLGMASSPLTDTEFRDAMKAAIVKNDSIADVKKIEEFSTRLNYFPMNFKDPGAYNELKNKIRSLSGICGESCNYIFYLATIPSLFAEISVNLGKAGLNKSSSGYSRIIVEKPFGYDLASAIELNNTMHEIFDESQIYRIDHYLGKETVQNVLVTRFANGIFEPIWNRNYVHHIEVTSAENLGIENRGGYYETSGALRDMVQSHLLRLVTLIAMEPPSSFDSDAVRNEQLKVLQSLRKLKPEEIEDSVIRGQYIASTINGKSVKGYREEKDVNPDSRTETYAAVKFYIDNWRWGGVPFYIRTGKQLPTRVTEAVIHFRKTPHYLFKESQNITDNQLILRIQPDEGILLKFGMKEPGSGFKVHNVNMDFHYSDISNIHIPEAYERLIYDCMIGDSTLFLRADAVEEAWKFVEPIQKAWDDDHKVKIYGYPAGTWGPDVADNLIAGGEHITWRYPCKNLADDGVYCEL